MACCGSKPNNPPQRRPAAPKPVVGLKTPESEPDAGRPGSAADLGSLEQPAGPKAAVVHTTEQLPPSLQYWPNGKDKYIRVSKSTYPANAPNEDRCTVAADTEKGYIFAGVWDGHGAPPSGSFLAVTQCLVDPARYLRSWRPLCGVGGPTHHGHFLEGARGAGVRNSLLATARALLPGPSPHTDMS